MRNTATTPRPRIPADPPAAVDPLDALLTQAVERSPPGPVKDWFRAMLAAGADERQAELKAKEAKRPKRRP